MNPESNLPDGAVIDPEGVWTQVLRPPPDAAARPTLFVDRDGVLVEDDGYLFRPEEVRLIPGAGAVIARANSVGVPVVIVTNQGGIALGLYGWDAFARVQERMLAELDSEGAFVDGVFAAPHHPDAPPPLGHPDHPARKPNPGMLLRAAAVLTADLGRSWLIGDKASDIAAASRAGLAGALHVLTGHGGNAGQREAALAFTATGGFEVRTADSVAGAAALIPLFET